MSSGLLAGTFTHWATAFRLWKPDPAHTGERDWPRSVYQDQYFCLLSRPCFGHPLLTACLAAGLLTSASLSICWESSELGELYISKGTAVHLCACPAPSVFTSDFNFVQLFYSVHLFSFQRWEFDKRKWLSLSPQGLYSQAVCLDFCSLRVVYC